MKPPIAPVRTAVAATVLLLLAFGAVVVWRASRALHSAAGDVRSEHEIHFVVRPLPPAVSADFEVISSPAVFFQASRFQDHLYVAGPAGLLEYEPSGTLLRQFSVGRELPGSPLIALAPAVLTDAREPELILATANDGLLAFNGGAFRQIFPYDSDARAITAILPCASGHLLIGTKKRGLLVYDGKQITVFRRRQRQFPDQMSRYRESSPEPNRIGVSGAVSSRFVRPAIACSCASGIPWLL